MSIVKQHSCENPIRKHNKNSTYILIWDDFIDYRVPPIRIAIGILFIYTKGGIVSFDMYDIQISNKYA